MSRQFTAVVERDPDTGLYVGYVPRFRGAHSQAASLDQLTANCGRSLNCCSKTNPKRRYILARMRVKPAPKQRNWTRDEIHVFTPRIHRMAAKVPDLLLLHQVVAPEILAAMKSASAQLTRSRVRHALIGALAVGAWGYPRASKDVAFLVGDEAFEHHEGNIVTMAAGVPIGVEGIAIDHLGALPEERHLEAGIESASYGWRCAHCTASDQ